ncbi:hypothetical protein C8R46DRAFT_1036141 [Mycena filopes]|nr:hypothetical protein C8R46DRAFT_1036141 [Mycena filopes]
MPPKKPTQPKAKQMYSPYDASLIPDRMPLPEVSGSATSKGQEIPLPKLNEGQRSYLHDVLLRDVDFTAAGNKKKARKAFYTQLQNDALQAKPSQHVPHADDAAEEATIPALLAAWKKKNPKSVPEKTNADDDDDDSENEEDDATIQRLISNKRQYFSNKVKKSNTGVAVVPPADDQAAFNATTLKLTGLTSTTGRDSFRDAHRDDILALSKTLPGSNAGGKFRRAETMLWEQEDHNDWETVAASTENVDWEERQALVPTAFKNVSAQLNGSGKFRTFITAIITGWADVDTKMQMDWQVVCFPSLQTEAVPPTLNLPQSFERRYPHLVQQLLNAFYEWAAPALKASATKSDVPPFPFAVEQLDDISRSLLKETVESYLTSSYEIVFATTDIPWAAIADNPDEFYDTQRFAFTFPSSGLANFDRAQWDELGAVLASGARGATPGFFRKVQEHKDDDDHHHKEQDDDHNDDDDHHKEQDNADADAKARADADAKAQAEADLKAQAEADAKARADADAKAQADTDAKAQADADAAAAAAKELKGKGKGKGKAKSKANDDAQNRGQKRVAEDVPEAAEVPRAKRLRQTPQEAEKARQNALAEELSRATKPSWQYVQRTPVKRAEAKKPRKRYFVELKTSIDLKSNRGLNTYLNLKMNLNISFFQHIGAHVKSREDLKSREGLKL